MSTITPMDPQEVWNRIHYYSNRYYDGLSALYSGDHKELTRTARTDTFWKRRGKCRIHVPLGSDIAATSANLLFGNAPTFSLRSEMEDPDGIRQKRLEELIGLCNLESKLSEAAESCSALGDIYMKCRWSRDVDHPALDVVQPDNAWPEYTFDELSAVHFFTTLASDPEHDRYRRIYECYTRGHISMAIFDGNGEILGQRQPDNLLEELGYAAEIDTPVDEILAVHITNMRPNRNFRSSNLGRSDLDGLRDLCDALDEAYTSWMRDIRLAKARMVIPVDYLRRKPQEMLEGCSTQGMWDFDMDQETFVAMDIDTDRVQGNPITLSQFNIRSAEHQQICDNLITNIIQMAGYSPQSFGIGINGSAESGTALSIRERRSAITKNKKQLYWQAPMEKILTAMVRMDAALYPEKSSLASDVVVMSFTDTMGADLSNLAATVAQMRAAQAASVETSVRILHPDWGEEEINAEVERVTKEYGQPITAPEMLLGDFENPEAGE